VSPSAFSIWKPSSSASAATGQPPSLTARTALEACDQLIAQRLCESVEAARSWLQHADLSADKTSSRDFPAQECLVTTAGKLLGKKMDGQAMLAAVNRHRGTVPTDSFAARELAAVAEVAGQLADSPLLGQLPEPMREAASRADIMRKRIFPRAPAEQGRTLEAREMRGGGVVVVTLHPRAFACERNGGDGA
jgi:hypothetical protein